MKILVTGGAGFIGSHIVDRLIEEGHSVRVFDCLEDQVHQGKKPDYLNNEAEYIFADVRNKEKLRKALKGIEVVFHEAAQVGDGQSMYEIEKYISHNCDGTAVLLDILVNSKHSVEKFIVASSMSIYGEGAYRCKKCDIVYPGLRAESQLKKKQWEMTCPHCQAVIERIPTPEEKPTNPTSVYSLSKRFQEDICLQIGKAYNIPTVAFRYFNAFGPRQSLSNPYTGVAAIFLSRVKNNNPPIVYEDGGQSRDFIYVSDIARANILAMNDARADYEVFNLGTGIPQTILGIANTIIALSGKQRKVAPEVLAHYRTGDIRHCYADTTKIAKKLGFKPAISFIDGMRKLMEWSNSQKAKDMSEKAQKELSKRGLVH